MGPNLAWNRIELQIALLQSIREVGAHITAYGKAEDQWNTVNDVFFNLPQNEGLKDLHYRPGNARKLRDKWSDLYRQSMIAIKSMTSDELAQCDNEVLKLVQIMHEEKENAEFSRSAYDKKGNGVIQTTLKSTIPGNQSSKSAVIAATLKRAHAATASDDSSDDGVELDLPKNAKQARTASRPNATSSIVALATAASAAPALSTKPVVTATTVKPSADAERQVRDKMVQALEKEHKTLAQIADEMEIKKDRQRWIDLMDEIGIKSLIFLYATPGENFSQPFFRKQAEDFGLSSLISLKLYTWLELFRTKVSTPAPATST